MPDRLDRAERHNLSSGEAVEVLLHVGGVLGEATLDDLVRTVGLDTAAQLVDIVADV